MISHYLASRWNLSQPCPGLQAVHLDPSQRIELPADLFKKSPAGLFQHGHTQGTAAGRLEAGRAPTRVAEEGSGGKLAFARFSKLGTSGKQDRSSTSPSLPGCQNAWFTQSDLYNRRPHMRPPFVSACPFLPCEHTACHVDPI